MNIFKHLQSVSFLFWLIPALFIGGWLILLILCLRRREFYRLFDKTSVTRFFWLITFPFLNPALTFLYLIFGQFRSPAKVAGSAMRWTMRGTVVAIIILGFYVRVPVFAHGWMDMLRGPELQQEKGYNAHAATIVSNQSTSTSSSSAQTNHCPIACRSLWLVPADNEILTMMICDYLEEALQKSKLIQQIAYFRDQPIPAGQRTPDIVMQVRVDHYQTHNWPLKYDLTASIKANAFHGPWGNRCHHFDNNSIPAMEFNWNCEIQHESTTTGYESHKFNLAASKIAEELSDSLKKYIEGQQKKDGSMPSFPDYLYPDYQPVDVPDVLAVYEPEILFTASRMLTPNETLFRFPITDPVSDVLKALCSQFKENGWTIASRSIGEHTLNNIRIENDHTILQIYHMHQDDQDWDPVPLHHTEETVIDREYLYGFYRSLMPQTEIKTALERFLNDSVPIEHLMLLENLFDYHLYDQFMARLERAELNSAAICLKLGTLYQSRKQTDKALDYLKKAIILDRIGSGSSKHESDIKNLAKKLESEALLDEELDTDCLMAMGAIDAKTVIEHQQLELPPGRPLILFGYDKNNTLTVYTVKLTPTLSGNPQPWQIEEVTSRKGSKSWGTQSCMSAQGVYSNVGSFYLDPESTSPIQVRLEYHTDAENVMYQIEPMELSNL